MEVPGKSPNSLSFRYNANNEELEELHDVCDDDPPTPRCDASASVPSENPSPKKNDKTSSIIDKYFKSMRVEKAEKVDKPDESKADSSKSEETPQPKGTPSKEVSSSPVKDYLNRFSKKSTSDVKDVITEVKDANETWKIFHDFKFKIAQAVEDMKSRSNEETKEKSVPRENSMSDSEENSAMKDSDISVGDTDNQVSSIDSSIQNLSEFTQPLTARANNRDPTQLRERQNSESTDDTHKNIDHNDSIDIPKDEFDDSFEVESGVEVLEDTNIEGMVDVTQTDVADFPQRPTESGPTQTTPIHIPYLPPQPSKSDLPSVSNRRKTYFMTTTMYILIVILVLSFAVFPDCWLWNGFVLGLVSFYLLSHLKRWLLDRYFTELESDGSMYQLKRSNNLPSTYTIPSIKEHRPLKKYEGWINHYRFPDYDPYTYHINKTTTSFVKLEGCNLRISYTKTKVAKRALWDEKIEHVSFYQHRLYNLTGARVILLPKGLVNRRLWSKKYPICVILNEKEKIQILEKEALPERRLSESAASDKKRDSVEVESAETSTSPEKKKKFVWRKKDKSIIHSEGEVSTREGLRHRIVRKMHRDKKSDNVSTITEQATEGPSSDKRDETEESPLPDAEPELTSKSMMKIEEDDIGEAELLRIREFLEEAEAEACLEGGAESEWSVHVKQSKHVYLFARTGRDKHEWYRRLNTAISEANSSAESSTADDNKTTSEIVDRDADKIASYKVSDKDSVSFSKTQNKTSIDASADPGSNSTTPHFLFTNRDMESYEKSFWPYLFKIIQSKTPSQSCQCHLLSPEVTWLNTLIARVAYDGMRDPLLIGKVQDRIQRKLNTLKLPSFMSPLIVTELSLAGACPLVERMSGPTWDERGVWLDADLRYGGGAYISILTQINLMKLKEKNVTLEEQLLSTADNVVEQDMNATLTGGLFSEKQMRERKPAIYYSDVEDSAESSSDDETPPVQPVDSGESINVDPSSSEATPQRGSDSSGAGGAGVAGGSGKKKFLRMVDKIATNKYFQTVTDYKYVKRAMEGLSNTDIKLQLEIHGLEGKLALNFPPPPHDRVWIGFRTNPQLVLKARPAFGARALRFAHITNWIEQKLSKEFEKFLVLPNMEDFHIELMTPTPVDYE